MDRHSKVETDEYESLKAERDEAEQWMQSARELMESVFEDDK